MRVRHDRLEKLGRVKYVAVLFITEYLLDVVLEGVGHITYPDIEPTMRTPE